MMKNCRQRDAPHYVWKHMSKKTSCISRSIHRQIGARYVEQVRRGPFEALPNVPEILVSRKMVSASCVCTLVNGSLLSEPGRIFHIVGVSRSMHSCLTNHKFRQTGTGLLCLDISWSHLSELTQLLLRCFYNLRKIQKLKEYHPSFYT